MPKVALVTGGSSGIGRATAELLAKRGCVVYTLSRRPAAVPGARHICADVTDATAMRAAVAQISAEQGRLDILINNAGGGVSGAIEFITPEAAARLLDLNFLAAARLSAAVLPLMRSQGAGRIVNVSSVAAPVAIPFQAYYSASKAALNAFSLALANEARPFGVSVCAVMPGDIHTNFTASRVKQHAGDDIYQGRISRSVAAMERDEENGMPAAVAAAAVCRLALKKNPKPLCAIGCKYKLFTILARLLPVRLLNYIVGLLYAR